MQYAYEDGVKKGQLKDFDPKWAANHFLALGNAIAWWYRQGEAPRRARLPTPSTRQGMMDLHGRRKANAPEAARRGRPSAAQPPLALFAEFPGRSCALLLPEVHLRMSKMIRLA